MTKKVYLSFLLIVSISSQAQILGGGTLFSNAVTFNQSWLTGCPSTGTILSNQAALEPTTAMDPCVANAPTCATGTAASDVWFTFLRTQQRLLLSLTPVLLLMLLSRHFPVQPAPD